MSAKTRLQHSVLQVLNRDNSGSFASKHDRKNVLQHFAEELVSLGYKLPAIDSLKQKHVVAIVEHWRHKGLRNQTIKNRLSCIRHLASLLGKSSSIPTNKELNIGPRQNVLQINRAIHDPNFSKIRHEYLRISLELQRVFGLRREESLKIKPHLADKGASLELQPSWCKGGRGRRVPIRTDEQRYWLDEAKKFVGNFGNSLIPPEKSYIQQRWVYDKQTYSAGLKNLHGLRHAYAQSRYQELTGWKAPIEGGPSVKEMSTEQIKMDHLARMILTEELGHSRKQIVKNYLG